MSSFTPVEWADKLGVSHARVLRWAASGFLPPAGRDVRWTLEQVTGCAWRLALSRSERASAAGRHILHELAKRR